MKIAVLAGGYSPERDVSLSSGSLIANALMENGHDVMLLDAYLGVPEGGVLYRNREKYEYAIPERPPDLARLRRESGNGDLLIGKGVLEICRKADAVFIALHGAMGENGQIQALFDLYGIRYTGSGYAGCLLAMDKALSKKLMRAAGIRTPDWSLLSAGEEIRPEARRFPCVVKPCGCGSSAGVSIVETTAELEQAIEAARLYEDTALIEDKITGREFSVGVLEGETLPAIEIIPRAGFYDYKNKYQAGRIEEICPAGISRETEAAMAETALRLHRELRLGCYSRTDFIMDRDGVLYCLEINTLPGMTPASLLPQEAKAAGISYNELCERIMRAALRTSSRVISR